jgi:hypothetical protein
MTVTLGLEPGLGARLKARAEAMGVSAEKYLQSLIVSAIPRFL